MSKLLGGPLHDTNVATECNEYCVIETIGDSESPTHHYQPCVPFLTFREHMYRKVGDGYMVHWSFTPVEPGEHFLNPETHPYFHVTQTTLDGDVDLVHVNDMLVLIFTQGFWFVDRNAIRELNLSPK